MEKRITNKDQGITESPSNIAVAIDNIRKAQMQISAFARERASRQLSTQSLTAVSKELSELIRRMSVYVKD